MIQNILTSSLFLAVFCIPATQLFAQTVLLDPTDNSVAIGIENLDIMGQSFDVNLSRSGDNFTDIFGEGEPPETVPFFYNDVPGADAARNAISTALSNLNVNFVGSASNQLDEISIPTVLDSDPLVRYNARYLFLEDDRQVNFAGITRTFRGAVIPTFSATAVPEPSSALLGLLAAPAIALRRRRRISA